MPLPKRQVVPSKVKKAEDSKAKKSEGATSKNTEDSRFANFQSDAKYRLPAKKHSKTQLDDRFSRLLTDPDFYNKASVDKYGRKRDKNAGKKELARLYNAGTEEESDEEDLDTEAARKMDKAVNRELKKVDIRGQGDNDMSSSSDESSSDEEEDFVEVDDEAELAQPGADIPEGEVTARLAAVNMDWDNIRAKDILAVAESFLPPGGSIKSVVIYPSEFGMERMQREEIEGPPREIFASSSAKNKNNITSISNLADNSSDSENDGNDGNDGDEAIETGEEFDSKALRQYQLDRLRYYYAILTCSSPSAAKSIYDNLDGREYLSSANFFDLRFVPDDTTFDTDPHDECDRLPDGYKPNEFSTDALTHSKVKLTWDAEDTARKEVQKRAFSRKEVDDLELQAYIGSDSDSEQEVAPDKAASLRAALGLGSGDTSKSKKSTSSSSKRDRDFQKPEGEMQVTFSAGLSASSGPKGGSVFENDIPTNETTLEKYVRKQKERKQRRKERAKAIAEGRDPDAGADEAAAGENAANDDNDDPWNDPFFASGPSKPSASEKKSKKAKKREEKEKEEAEKATERANLELLMVDDEDARMRHFDMNEIMKAEKAKKKRGKKNKNKDGDAAAADDGFKIDTVDPRFAQLYESHEFAIDPTNPRFKETSGMKALLEEGRKKRKHDRDDGEPDQKKKNKKTKQEEVAGDGDDLKKLAARVKAKARMA